MSVTDTASRSRGSIIPADLSLGKVTVARLKSRRFFRYLGLLTQGELDVREPRFVVGGAVVITVVPDRLHVVTTDHLPITRVSFCRDVSAVLALLGILYHARPPLSIISVAL